jgi:hypothetical protein
MFRKGVPVVDPSRGIIDTFSTMGVSHAFGLDLEVTSKGFRFLQIDICFGLS